MSPVEKEEEERSWTVFVHSTFLKVKCKVTASTQFVPLIAGSVVRIGRLHSLSSLKSKFWHLWAMLDLKTSSSVKFAVMKLNGLQRLKKGTQFKSKQTMSLKTPFFMSHMALLNLLILRHKVIWWTANKQHFSLRKQGSQTLPNL